MSPSWENLVKIGSQGYLFSLGHFKMNQDGKVHPNNDRPIAGQQAVKALSVLLDSCKAWRGRVFCTQASGRGAWFLGVAPAHA